MTRINCIDPSLLNNRHLLGVTKEGFEKILRENDYYIAKAARYLGVPRSRVYSLIKYFGITVPKRAGAPKKWETNIDKANNIYYKMINRCYNERSEDYAYYGGRGIKVCWEWVQNRDIFVEYCLTLPNAFKKGFSLDRRDNDKGYFPGNVRFVSHREQCNNRRSNVHYMIKGVTKTLAQWAEEYNLKWEFVRDRINKLGWTIEEALTVPKGVRRDSYKRDRP